MPPLFNLFYFFCSFFSILMVRDALDFAAFSSSSLFSSAYVLTQVNERTQITDKSIAKILFILKTSLNKMFLSSQLKSVLSY